MKNPESHQNAKLSKSSGSILSGALSSANTSKATSKPASKATSLSGPDAAKKRRPKLRPALDVLNRLRWDEAYKDDDFVIGYEDRFTGVMEVPMDCWRQEQTDEEFIPQHRILYFRHGADDVHLWDK